MADIKNSLDQIQLVLATGFRKPYNDGDPKVGHAWVVDGYAVTRLNSGETIVGNNVWQRYNMYLHANMDWGRPIITPWYTNLNGTGWYLVGKDNNGSLTFKTDTRDWEFNLTFYPNFIKK